MNVLQSLQNAKTQWSHADYELNFYKIFLESYSFIKNYPKKFLALYVANILFVFVIHKMNLLVDISQYNSFIEIILYMSCLFFIFSLFIHTITYSCIEKSLSMREIFSLFFKQTIKLFSSCFIFACCLLISSFLIIPAVYLILTALFFIPEILFNNKKIFESFKSSISLLKNHLSLSAYIFISPVLFMVFLHSMSFYFHYALLNNIIINITLNSLLISMFTLLYLNLYLNLKLNKS